MLQPATRGVYSTLKCQELDIYSIDCCFTSFH